jgi:hypothetical protein
MRLSPKLQYCNRITFSYFWITFTLRGIRRRQKRSIKHIGVSSEVFNLWSYSLRWNELNSMLNLMPLRKKVSMLFFANILSECKSNHRSNLVFLKYLIWLQYFAGKVTDYTNHVICIMESVTPQPCLFASVEAIVYLSFGQLVLLMSLGHLLSCKNKCSLYLCVWNRICNLSCVFEIGFVIWVVCLK